MTRYESLITQIDANTARLLDMDRDSREALDLRAVQAELLTRRMALTIGEAGEEIKEGVS